VNLTDNQTSIVRMSSVAAGALLIQMGLDPVMQVTCRDRNRLAIQSDILGASALGIRNVLAISGDHQKFGNQPGAKSVFDLDSIQLLQMLDMMRNGKFPNGDDIKKPPELFLGAAENPFSGDMEMRVRRMAKKIKSGAEFIQTQPVYDMEMFNDWMKRVRDRGLHEKTAILAGVIPVKSARMAAYMRDNVSGVVVPDEIVKRMESAADPKEEGVKISVELIQKLREVPGVRGIHIMAVAWEEIVPEIVQRAGLTPRPKTE
jgi:methylenetetrahydrofolate reductase (NADPH)